MRAIVLVCIALVITGVAMAADLPTPHELAPDTTPRYAETMEWCRTLASRHPTVTVADFGTSPEGRDLPLVIWDRDGLHTPDLVHRAGRTVLLVEACIHAGESCGKDAGMIWLRDLAEQGGPADVTVLFIPIFNVDGHERFGPHNRVNQNGPREMGWRVTAQNLNLNRDFLKADAPEMQSWLALWNLWRPHFFVDIHSTDGADYQYVITYGLELRGNLDQGLTDWTADYLAVMETGLADAGFPLSPYVSFRRWHDPRSGIKAWVAGPRYSQGYAAVRNRPGLLIETHMLKPYPVRVEATRIMLEESLKHLAVHGADLRHRAAVADQHAASAAFRAEPLPLRWQDGEQARPFRFLGVAYEQVTSELSGGEYFIYHGDQPETCTVDFFDQPQVAVSAAVPEAYLIPAQWTTVIDRLRRHDVRLERLTESVSLAIDGWRLDDCSWRQRPYEGRHTVNYTARPVRERREFPAGTWVVDTAQPAARAIVHLLDPAAPDALLRWGFFNAQLTRVEYVESYVIEAMMKEMVAADPTLVDSLAAAKARDRDFAADPRAIREWFFRQTPYYDERAFLYPVAAVFDRDEVEAMPRAGAE